MAHRPCLRREDWRYRLVCALSRLLWGRRLGYLSWWPHAARSAGVSIMRHDGHCWQILLGKRQNVADAPGKWSSIGGFVDHGETFIEGLCREIFEETGLALSPDDFGPNALLFMDEQVVDMAEMHGVHRTTAFYVYIPDDAQLRQLQASGEVSRLTFVDENTLHHWYRNGYLAFEGEYHAACAAFARVKTA